MSCSDLFARNLRSILQQFGISSVQLAKAVGVDPSLVSRWRRCGCSGRNGTAYALAVAAYLADKNRSPENAAWLAARLRDVPLPPTAPDTARLALWLYPDADVDALLGGEDEYPNLLVVNSFRDAAVLPGRRTLPPNGGMAGAEQTVSAGIGQTEILTALRGELERAPVECLLSIHLSSEAAAIVTCRPWVQLLHEAVQTRGLRLRMLVQSANNSAASSKLVSAYMQLLVAGSLELCIIQGTPQTFATTVHVLIPGVSALTVSEAPLKDARPVMTLVRDPEMVSGLLDNFERSLRFARPMMTAYDDSFARNIIETFFEEYGVPGSLDVIKCGLNPMFMSVERYREVLRAFGHEGEQYRWRHLEFARFKSAMAQVLQDSRFREVLSLQKLREVARTGQCKMPAMYFMDTGVWHLNAADCVNILDGYIEALERVPNFHVILLEDEALFMPNSCWHIKSNRHIMIHSWNTDRPMMVYSDQMMLIDEFQKHFDHLWSKVNLGGSSKRAAIETLRQIRTQCAESGLRQAAQ
ncbi:MAG: helix-turn-helix transcriptional regulator [Candidatus Limiplasma sp.]|nr:helix-turn-helix transcriptional regulator [Candidatus Limiplasma sp.]